MSLELLVTDFFALYSVITTVTLFTVTSRVCAELLSTLLSRGVRLFLPCELADLGLLVELVGAVPAAWAATSAGLSLGFRVDVPFLTSHMEHLKASALFLYVQTLQSQ